MAHWSDCYETHPDAVVVAVHVQPRGRTALVGRHGHALKLRVAAPPVADRANDEVVAFLADLAGIKAKDASVVSGRTSRVKRDRLPGADADALERAIDVAVERGEDPARRRR